MKGGIPVQQARGRVRRISRAGQTGRAEDSYHSTCASGRGPMEVGVVVGCWGRRLYLAMRQGLVAAASASGRGCSFSEGGLGCMANQRRVGSGAGGAQSPQSMPSHGCFVLRCPPAGAQMPVASPVTFPAPVDECASRLAANPLARATPPPSSPSSCSSSSSPSCQARASSDIRVSVRLLAEWVDTSSLPGQHLLPTNPATITCSAKLPFLEP